MRLYLDAGVVRIQEYLTRTSGSDERQLRKRRGASRMVADATAPSTFADLGLNPNRESYHVEGVAHLHADMAGEEDPARRANGLAEQVANRLRQALPHAYARVSWALADTYAVAHPLLAAARLDGSASHDAGSVDVLPRLREDPFSGRCRACGLAEAFEGGQCRDCDLRDANGGTADRVAPPGGPTDRTPRSRALSAASDLAGRQLLPPRDLSALANLPQDRRAKRNHLAVVYADGNSVGRLFECIADRKSARTLSTAIDAAIAHAGAEALHDLLAWCDPGVLPAEVSVLAADDALITVPAPLGWTFVRHLIDAFDEAMAQTPVIDQLTAAPAAGCGQLMRPSLTAGVVFCHVKSPIETAIQAADRAMRTAKGVHPGKAAIGWADLTRPAPSEASCARDWFLDRSALLDRIAGLPASRREGWARDIADARAAEIPDEALKGFLQADFRRVGDGDLADADLTPEELNWMLSISRWWLPPRRRHELVKGGSA